MAAPTNHPQRFALNYGRHPRSREAIDIPEQASYPVLATDPSNRRAEYERIVEPGTRQGVTSPTPDPNHFRSAARCNVDVMLSLQFNVKGERLCR